ncbi:MAG: hypothetical protein U0234_06830 [Sandaracinus sp.]
MARRRLERESDEDIVPRRRGAAAIEDRVSDPPLTTSPLRRFGIGCAIAAALAFVGIGALGLAFVSWQRFAAPAIQEARQTPDDGSGGGDPSTGGGPTPIGGGNHGTSAGTASGTDPLAEMRRRYIPGRYVHVEGMIPSDQAYVRTGSLSPWQSGRSADTPWLVLGATYDRASMASATASPPRISHAQGELTSRPLDVIAGVPAEARVSASDAAGGTDVTEYLVSFEGYPGTFHLATTVQTELGVVQAAGSDGASVRFTIGAPMLPDRTMAPPGRPFRAFMLVSAVDSQGHVSAPVRRELSVLPVGTGDVEVAMTMSIPTDLDLYVTDPAGTTVYFGNTSGFSGGHLDLDANAACSGHMGANSEHIFWPAHGAPAGTYTVRVAHYESCIGGAPVDYRVTVRACGETVVLTGNFAGGSQSQACMSSQPDGSWCQDVVTFQLPSCS